MECRAQGSKNDEIIADTYMLPTRRIIHSQGSLPKPCSALQPFSHPKGLNKVLSFLTAYLCQWGLIVFPYLDDWLCKICSLSKIQSVINKALVLFHSLDLCLNLSLVQHRINQSHSRLLNHESLVSKRQARYDAHPHYQTATEHSVHNEILPPTTGHIPAYTFVTPHAQLPPLSWLGPFTPPGETNR